jgi:hypothetical protein
MAAPTAMSEGMLKWGLFAAAVFMMIEWLGIYGFPVFV